MESTENTNKKSGAKKAPTKKTTPKKNDTKKTTKKSEVKSSIKDEKKQVKKVVKSEKKTDVKKIKSEDKIDVKKIKSEEIISEEKIKPLKKEVVEEDSKPLVEVIEESKESMLTRRTWIITCVCAFMLLIAIVAININNKVTIKENDYYVYSKDNKLILWDQNTNKKATLTSNYVVDSKNSTVNYPSETLYNLEDNKVYFIDNVTASSFDLYYIDLEKAFTNPESKKLIEAGVTDYKVVGKNVYYVKNKELTYFASDKKTKIIDDVETFETSSTGEKLFYTDSEATLYEFNTKDLKSKVVAEDMNSAYYAIGEELVYFSMNKHDLSTMYNESGLIADNITNYIKTDKSIIYFQITEDKLKAYEPGMKALKENQVTLDQFKNIMKNKEAVLFYFGKPSCSYCASMDKAFTAIKKTNDFTYVYVNVSAIDSDVVYEMLDLVGVKSSEFGTPTLVVTKDNKVIDKNIGYLEEAAAKTFLQKNGIFTSKFKYENPERTNFTSELLFLVSNTFKYDGKKAEKFTDGLLYAGDTSKIENANYQLSFVLPDDFDYVNTTESDLYYKLKLVLTRTSSGKTIKTNLTYTDLQFLSYDTDLNNVYYQTDSKVIRNTFTQSSLKEKDKFGSVCSMSSSPYATYLVTDCDSEYKGDLYKVTRYSSKKIDSEVVQAYAIGKSAYYLKNIDSSYIIYNSKGKELDKDLYLPIEFDDDFFYIKQITTGETTEGSEENKTYDLYYATEDKPIKIDTGVDINVSIIPIG